MRSTGSVIPHALRCFKMNESKKIRRYHGIIDGRPGSWIVFFPDLPGVQGRADTATDAVKDSKRAIVEAIALMKSKGEQIPEPRTLQEVLADHNARTGDTRCGGVTISVP